MSESYQIGERVQIFLDAKFGERSGWYAGMVVRIDPYSDYRSFYWVRLDEAAQAILNTREISVFNPKNIRRESQI